MQSPFKFLDSYTRDDREFFFGRDREIEALYQKVFESKILLVYGVSGTGKSSLIHCGLASKFNESDWLPVNIRRGRDINEATLMELQKAALTEVNTDLNKPKWMSKLIRSLYLDHFKPVYLVYDQFEELMIFGSKTEKQQFVQSVKAVVDSDLQCRFLFVIREEYLAGITEFERIIPEILGNRVRIEKMGFENARQAIEGPCRIAGIEVEEGFSENMLNRLTSGGGEIELTYLQVFLDRLYKQATGNGAEGHVPAFTNALVDNCGNVKDLLGDFLDEQVKSFENSDLAMTMLKSLVSGKGTKKQATQDEIADFCRSMGKTIEPETLTTLLNHFVNLRILRDRDNYGRYELRHDALAEKIFENISIAEKELFEVRQFVENAYELYLRRGVLLSKSDLNYLAPYSDKLYLSREHETFIKRSQSELTKARRRRTWILSSAAIVLLIVLSGFTWWAMRERSKAEEQSAIAQAEKIKADAISLNLMAKELAETDPTKALRIAEKALQMDTANEDIRKNLYNIYYHNNFYKTIFEAGEQVTCFAQHPISKDYYLGLENGSVKIINCTDFSEKVLHGHENSVTSIVFSEDSKSALSASLDCTAILWVNDTVHTIFQNKKYGYENVGERKYALFVDDYVVANLAYNEIFVFNRDGSLNRIIDAHADRITVLKNVGDIVVTASADNTIKIWSKNFTLLKTLKVDDRMFTCSSLKEGKLYFSGYRCGYMIDKDFNILFKDTYDEPVYSSAASIDGKRVYLGYGSNRIMCRNILNWEQSDWFKGHADRVVDIYVSPDDSCIYSVAFDGNLKRWTHDAYLYKVIDDLAEITQEENFIIEELVGRITFAKKSGITKIVVSPDKKSVLISTMAGELKLYDSNGNFIREYVGFTHGIYDIAFSKDGKMIVAGSFDKKAKVWGIDGSFVAELIGGTNVITSVGFTQTGDTVITAGYDKMLRFYNLQGKLLSEVLMVAPITAMNVAHDINKLLIMFGLNNQVFIVDYSGKGKDFIFSFKGIQGLPPNSQTIYIDSTKIVNSFSDNDIILTDVHGNYLTVFSGHVNTVFDFSITTDNQYLISCASDNTIKFWSINGVELWSYKTSKPVSQIEFIGHENSFVYSIQNIAYFMKFKQPYEEFQKLNNYDEMRIYDLCSYKLLADDYWRTVNSIDSLIDAKNYYIQHYYKPSTLSKRSENLKFAIQICEKIVQDSISGKFILEFQDVMMLYENLTGTNFSFKINKAFFTILQKGSYNDLSYILQMYLGRYRSYQTVDMNTYYYALTNRLQLLAKEQSRSIDTVYSMYFYKANECFLARDYEYAKLFAEQALKIAPANHYTYLLLPLIYLVTDEDEKAIEIIEKYKKMPLSGGSNFGDFYYEQLIILNNSGYLIPSYDIVMNKFWPGKKH